MLEYSWTTSKILIVLWYSWFIKNTLYYSTVVNRNTQYVTVQLLYQNTRYVTVHLVYQKNF